MPRLPISLLSALAWGHLSQALVPADPTITSPAVLPRQNGDNFMGWLKFNETWTSLTCDAGLTWYQDATYAQCCPETLASCYAPTACVAGSVIYPYSDLSTTRTIACTENYNNTIYSICNTILIYENSLDSDPKTDIVCGVSSVIWSYTRSIAASETEIHSSETSSKPTASNTSPGAPLTTNPPASPEPTEKSKSKAWIAGAVVGPILGIAIIGALIFFCLRRRNKNKTPTQGAAAPLAPGAYPPNQPYTDEAKPQVATQGSYNPHDSYNQYSQQQPVSPAPQYSAPYGVSSSPPPQGHYAPESKPGVLPHVAAEQPQAAELAGPSATAGGSHVAEMSGDPSNR